MQPTPWRSSESLFLDNPIVLHTSRRAYFRWFATLFMALSITGLAYLYYHALPSQVETQLTLCLMIGADAWALARFGELLVRRIEVDFDDFHLRTLFTDENIPWNQIQHIEWWRRTDVKARYTNYRLQSDDRHTIAALSTDAWTNLPEGIGYIADVTQVTPIRMKPPVPEIARVAVMIVVPLAVLLFTVERSEAWRIVGFILIRIFWSVLVMHYTYYELRIARFYMLLLSLTFVTALIFIAGATVWQTLVVLLYTPVLEITVSTVFFKTQSYWKKYRKSQGAASSPWDV
jgi:hypothetical protein